MANVSVSGGQVKTPVGSAPIVPLVALGIGIYLWWFSLHYFRKRTASGGVLWPTAPVKALLTNTSVQLSTSLSPDEQAVETSASQLAAAQQQLTAQQGVTPGTGQSNPNALGQAVASGAGSGGSLVATGSAATNQSLAKMLAISMGLSSWTTGTEWSDWVKLWNQESGWDNTADNPTSGAYGIAQALGHGTSGTAGTGGRNEYGAEYGLTTEEAVQANDGNARYQIVWGIGYIQSTYGSPSAAWAHEVADNWY